MKVDIGKYNDWWGPYQVADMVFFWVPKYRFDGPLDPKDQPWAERTKEKFGDWLANTWFNDFCQWIDSKKKRKIKVHIDHYDVWSMDHTLALIIHPMLIKLKEAKHGSPSVDPEDAPTIGMGEVDDYGSDSKIHERWDWVLDELIWTFEQLKDDEEGYRLFYKDGVWDHDGRRAYEDRIDNGLRLFGKYYRGLWD